jgi:hypothetical protein
MGMRDTSQRLTEQSMNRKVLLLPFEFERRRN